tara:strand:+ start:96976 stop:97716 length:741 start_codon:yes stop_codon:yes gene_type:complete
MVQDYRKLSASKRIALIAASELKGYTSCFVGIGIPSDAACLAKLTVERNLNLIYESGVIGTLPLSKSYSTGSPSIANNADMITDSLAVFSELQACRIDVGLLSAAQIDKYGNLNSTTIGSYEDPKIRMVGSGGAHDIASLIPNLIILMPHDPRRFTENVDFITSPGSGIELMEQRRKYDLGKGPSILITDRAKFIMSDQGWCLDSVLSGFTHEEAVEDLCWDLKQTEKEDITIDESVLKSLHKLDY